MKVQHKFEVVAKCPSGGSTEYRVTMDLHIRVRFPLVEDILAALKELLAEPIYQEDLTRELASRFQANVTTEGRHLDQFDTRCEVP